MRVLFVLLLVLPQVLSIVWANRGSTSGPPKKDFTARCKKICPPPELVFGNKGEECVKACLEYSRVSPEHMEKQMQQYLTDHFTDIDK